MLHKGTVRALPLEKALTHLPHSGTFRRLLSGFYSDMSPFPVMDQKKDGVSLSFGFYGDRDGKMSRGLIVPR
jgi:hypothetical protein